MTEAFQLQLHFLFQSFHSRKCLAMLTLLPNGFYRPQVIPKALLTRRINLSFLRCLQIRIAFS